jgi:hypothetical protein
VKAPYFIAYDDFKAVENEARSAIVISEEKVSMSDIACDLTCFDIDNTEI